MGKQHKHVLGIVRNDIEAIVLKNVCPNCLKVIHIWFKAQLTRLCRRKKSFMKGVECKL